MHTPNLLVLICTLYQQSRSVHWLLNTIQQAMVMRSQWYRHPVLWIIALAVFIYGSSKYPLPLWPSSLDHRAPLSGLTSVPYELTGKDADNYKWWTETRLRALASCTGKGNCAGNANKVSLEVYTPRHSKISHC